MGPENFRSTLDFVEKSIERLTLARRDRDEKNARVALLQFGSGNQNVAIKLTYNFTVISDGLDSMKYLDTASNVVTAIDYAINNILGSGNNRLARRNAEISFVFITDGVTGSKNLEEAVQAMRKEQVVPTVIAMGSDVEQEVLTKLAMGDQAAVFRGEDYSQLSNTRFIDRFVRWIC